MRADLRGMARNGPRECRQDQLRFDTSGQASKKVPDPGSTAVIVHQASKRQFIHDTFNDDIEFVLSKQSLCATGPHEWWMVVA